MPKRAISPVKAPRPAADYSQAWEVQNARLIFVSGQVPVDNSGNPVGVGDIAVQTRAVWENLKHVLEDAGAGIQDIVKLNFYVTNMAEFRTKAERIRREYFSRDLPTSTLVEVKSLARPEFMVEIEAIAAVG